MNDDLTRCLRCSETVFVFAVSQRGVVINTQFESDSDSDSPDRLLRNHITAALFEA